MRAQCRPLFALLLLTLAPSCRSGEAGVGPLEREASERFWARWSDGQAELSSYALTTPRYGEPRDGTAVLVYVLEEMDRRTWLKNDRGRVPEEHRAVVVKLNDMRTFQTGVYPYSIMTSVFSPVGGTGERFGPRRLTLTAQEWCGQIYQRVMPARGHFRSEVRSYFSVDGEKEEEVAVAPGALYEDALPIQLRELDGPFAGGGAWSGQLVPRLWSARASHTPLRPVMATISREDAQRDGVPVTRFTLRWGEDWRVFDVEKADPKRLLAWEGSDGEKAHLVQTARLAYWQLNKVGDEPYRERIGLPR